jgi:hypothetical protein
MFPLGQRMVGNVPMDYWHMSKAERGGVSWEIRDSWES